MTVTEYLSPLPPYNLAAKVLPLRALTGLECGAHRCSLPLLQTENTEIGAL